jgi:hypothetical protein
MRDCPCGSGKPREAQFDAQGIFLCYTCEDCEKKELSRYRPGILTGYTQADVDEPIEPDV